MFDQHKYMGCITVIFNNENQLWEWELKKQTNQKYNVPFSLSLNQKKKKKNLNSKVKCSDVLQSMQYACHNGNDLNGL